MGRLRSLGENGICTGLFGIGRFRVPQAKT